MKTSPLFKLIVLFAFIFNSLPIANVGADEFRLPAAGVMVHLSPEYNPPQLKGIKIQPNDPLKFDFILDKGEGDSNTLKDDTARLIRYFLSSITIPEKDLWVNLSPYEKTRIIPETFGQTEMGRDILAEDYFLKQITASLVYPENEVGQVFWKKIYQKASEEFHRTNIPVNTFNKVWIVPEHAKVYENSKAGTAFIIESSLKVMLETDYKAAQYSKVTQTLDQSKDSSFVSDIVRKVVIPELTKEVNTGRNFARLRQVYNSLILANWYKRKIKESILAQVYSDQNKIQGLISSNPKLNPQLIYQQYLQAFKKGVYNYIKMEQDPLTQKEVSRKYFSGGLDLAMNATSLRNAVVDYTNRLETSNTTELEVVHTRFDILDQKSQPDLHAFNNKEMDDLTLAVAILEHGGPLDIRNLLNGTLSLVNAFTQGHPVTEHEKAAAVYYMQMYRRFLSTSHSVEQINTKFRLALKGEYTFEEGELSSIAQSVPKLQKEYVRNLLEMRSYLIFVDDFIKLHHANLIETYSEPVLNKSLLSIERYISTNIPAILSIFFTPADFKNYLHKTEFEQTELDEFLRSIKWNTKEKDSFPIIFEGFNETVLVQKALIHIAIERLIENAQKALKNQVKAHELSQDEAIIRIRMERDHQNVRIVVSNPGDLQGKESDLDEFGISKLLTIRYGREKFNEGGVGLPFVRRAVENMQGKLKIENPTINGQKVVNFIIELPVVNTDNAALTDKILSTIGSSHFMEAIYEPSSKEISFHIRNNLRELASRRTIAYRLFQKDTESLILKILKEGPLPKDAQSIVLDSHLFVTQSDGQWTLNNFARQWATRLGVDISTVVVYRMDTLARILTKLETIPQLIIPPPVPPFTASIRINISTPEAREALIKRVDQAGVGEEQPVQKSHLKAKYQRSLQLMLAGGMLIQSTALAQKNEPINTRKTQMTLIKTSAYHDNPNAAKHFLELYLKLSQKSDLISSDIIEFNKLYTSYTQLGKANFEDIYTNYSYLWKQSAPNPQLKSQIETFLKSPLNILETVQKANGNWNDAAVRKLLILQLLGHLAYANQFHPLDSVSYSSMVLDIFNNAEFNTQPNGQWSAISTGQIGSKLIEDQILLNFVLFHELGGHRSFYMAGRDDKLPYNAMIGEMSSDIAGYFLCSKLHSNVSWQSIEEKLNRTVQNLSTDAQLDPSHVVPREELSNILRAIDQHVDFKPFYEALTTVDGYFQKNKLTGPLKNELAVSEKQAEFSIDKISSFLIFYYFKHNYNFSFDKIPHVESEWISYLKDTGVKQSTGRGPMPVSEELFFIRSLPKDQIENLVQSIKGDKSAVGGIDLSETIAKTVSNGMGKIQFQMDKTMLTRLQNAQGFIPTIINFEPLSDLNQFLGVN